MTPAPLLALVGPTASGKTETSLEIAERLGCDVVCIDSMLVYRGMDVGTAKPTPEQRRRVVHHMLDLVEPRHSFSVAEFQARARTSVVEIESRGRLPLLVGGSGLYYRAVVDDLEFPRTDPGIRRLLETEASVIGAGQLYGRLASFDPAGAGRIEARNVRRTVRALEVAAATGRSFSSYYRSWDRYPAGRVRVAGIHLPREALHRRIQARVERMWRGLLAETGVLLDRGFEPFLRSSNAIGYSEAVECLLGRMDEEDAAAATVRRTIALARHQMAWFRRDPRIRWFQAGEEGATGVADQVARHLAAGAGQASSIGLERLGA